MTVVMVWVMSASSSHALLLAWAAIIMMITLIELDMGALYLRQSRSHVEARKWERNYTYRVKLFNLASSGHTGFTVYQSEGLIE